MAAALSTLSTAAGHGSAGAIIIAGAVFHPSARGRPGDDITGDKAVRELIAKGPKPILLNAMTTPEPIRRETSTAGDDCRPSGQAEV